jgi:hypothetical protein
MKRQIFLPGLTEAFAYFLGLLLGDGCLGPISRPSVYLVGDLIDERDYYDRIVVPLISKLFGISSQPHPKKREQAYQLVFVSPAGTRVLGDQNRFSGTGNGKNHPFHHTQF